MFVKDKRMLLGYSNVCRTCANIKQREADRRWIKHHPELIKKRDCEISARYRKVHSHKVKITKANWQRNRKDLVNAAVAKRKAIKKQAVPKWADLNVIKEVYIEAKYMQMHVDHIVPLLSPLVCGLHVWDNLQLLDARTNISKGNRVWPDMP